MRLIHGGYLKNVKVICWLQMQMFQHFRFLICGFNLKLSYFTLSAVDAQTIVCIRDCNWDEKMLDYMQQEAKKYDGGINHSIIVNNRG